MRNQINDPRYWHKRAEESYTIAERMADSVTKRIMLNMAATYEKLAKEAEARARGQNGCEQLNQSRDDLGAKTSKGGMARAILDQRYAIGEISRQQYERLLQDLGWD
jgi:hypothetical protein